jgi:hypothetical protein
MFGEASDEEEEDGKAPIIGTLSQFYKFLRDPSIV